MPYDINIIRPEVNFNDVKIRKKEASPAKLDSFKKGFQTLHTLELMAQTIYSFQITGEPSELNRQLIAAMLSRLMVRRRVECPIFAAASAASQPACPAPTTITSYLFS